MAFREILVPVDFSGASRSAFERAVELAAGLKARLHVAHAVEVLTYRGVRYEEVLSPGAREREKNEARGRLEEWLELARERKVSAEVHVLEGDARHEILSARQRLGCDLIVMGAKGYSRVREILLGSVATEIARSARCSVLLVREDSERG